MDGWMRSFPHNSICLRWINAKVLWLQILYTVDQNYFFWFDLKASIDTNGCLHGKLCRKPATLYLKTT